MGNMTTYIILMTGLLLVFHLFGIIEQGTTINSQILNILMHPENLSFSDFFREYLLASITGAALVGTIIIGFVTKNTELAAMTGFAIFLGTVLFDFIAVYSVIAEFSKVLALVFFAPAMFLFVITIVDWWRGRD